MEAARYLIHFEHKGSSCVATDGFWFYSTVEGELLNMTDELWEVYRRCVDGTYDVDLEIWSCG
jgi:hypothetical protein